MLGFVPLGSAPLGSTGYEARVYWLEVRYVAGTGSLVPRRAMVLIDGRLRILPTGQEGLGLRPIVLMPDGTVRQRATTEGMPLIWKNNYLYTLNNATEQLVI